MEYKFTLKKLWKHICTVCEHKKNVARYCFKFGIGWRGIIHDMHKFSWTELYESAKYYTGNGSPIPIAKKENNSNIRHLCLLLFGIVDIFFCMMIVLPLYPNTIGETIYSVNLLSYSDTSLLTIK